MSASSSAITPVDPAAPAFSSEPTSGPGLLAVVETLLRTSSWGFFEVFKLLDDIHTKDPESALWQDQNVWTKLLREAIRIHGGKLKVTRNTTASMPSADRASDKHDKQEKLKMARDTAKFMDAVYKEAKDGDAEPHLCVGCLSLSNVRVPNEWRSFSTFLARPWMMWCHTCMYRVLPIMNKAQALLKCPLLLADDATLVHSKLIGTDECYLEAELRHYAKMSRVQRSLMKDDAVAIAPEHYARAIRPMPGIGKARGQKRSYTTLKMDRVVKRQMPQAPVVEQADCSPAMPTPVVSTQQ